MLVNNVYSAPDLAPWLGKPFWELPVEAWDEIIDIGVRSHYVASRFGVPMMLAQGSGLIVNVSSSGAIQYAHTVSYGVGKAALDKMTADMAHELEPHGVAVVSIWPGLVRTELVMFGARQTDDGRSVLDLPGEGTFDLDDAESPRFIGRGVVALATDAEGAGAHRRRVRRRRPRERLRLHRRERHGPASAAPRHLAAPATRRPVLGTLDRRPPGSNVPRTETVRRR